MAIACVARDFLGYAAVKKISGSGAVSNGTQINIPAALVSPRNPVNIGYPGVINASAYPTVSIVGKKTPSISIATYIKSSWFTANFLNSLIVTVDSNYDSDLWSVAVTDESLVERVYDDCRCSMVRLAQSGIGGPISFEATFVATYGENEKSVPATFTDVTSGSTGSLVDVAHVDFNSTATHVKSWELVLARTQAPQYFVDGTLYASCIASGPLGGSLTLSQSPNATTVPTTAFTARVFTAGDVPDGTKVTIACQTQLDELIRDHEPSLGVAVRNYSLIGLSGIPVVIS